MGISLGCTRRIARGTVAAVTAVLALAFAPSVSAQVSEPAIRAEDARADVRYLASPELEGRGALTGGLDKAAAYIARRFAAAGLAPGGEGGTFFQTVDIPVPRRLGGGTRLALGGVPLALGT